MHRLLVILACTLDGLALVVLLAGGGALLFAAHSGLPSAASSAEHATGMLLGALAVAAGLLALVMAGHATWCWRRWRALDARPSLRPTEIVVLAAGPAAATALLIALVIRLLA